MKVKMVLEKELKKIKPSVSELDLINKQTRELIKKIQKAIKQRKIKAEVFLGGSLAKDTIIKKAKYDVDLFVRFDKKYKNEEIDDRLSSILKRARIKNKRVHGSRDYFSINGKINFEIVPVKKIKKAEEAENVTDLSPLHVAYIKKKIKNKPKLADEIKLAKSFAYAQEVYGAESYIKGFSGYALELLVSYHGSFLKFLEKTSKKKQIIIDEGKFYKNKNEILTEINESKLQSPIIFIDPTFRERNALAALSEETFKKFQRAASSFLKHPTSSAFEKKTIDERKFNLTIKAKTSKQEGDIAGSKLKKFFRFFENKLKENYEIKRKEFIYDDKKSAKLLFDIKPKKQIIIRGPNINQPVHVTRFRKKHKRVFLKKSIVYAREKAKSVKQIISELKKSKILREMGVKI